ncbi:MAG: DNA polymerase ligase N-terminal domain-containing protein [Planctomycetia bacterium]|nr:DNA polymerase ligase N-terminal domain-containing protein [Planctomycetia bacterium]
MNFVVLTHEVPDKGIHFDFMLDNGSVLKTWSLSHSPDVNAAHLANTDSVSLTHLEATALLIDVDFATKQIIEKHCQLPPKGQKACILPDHRRIYLTFEGGISNDRGWVQQWDKGDYILLKHSATEVVVQLKGHKLRGIVLLISQNDGAWHFFYKSFGRELSEETRS